MDPVTALRQIAYYKDRNRHDPRRVMAYRNAADIIEGLDDAARQRHGQANSWQSLAASAGFGGADLAPLAGVFWRVPSSPASFLLVLSWRPSWPAAS